MRDAVACNNPGKHFRLELPGRNVKHRGLLLRVLKSKTQGKRGKSRSKKLIHHHQACKDIGVQANMKLKIIAENRG